MKIDARRAALGMAPAPKMRIDPPIGAT